jgi:hypothetical protein
MRNTCHAASTRKLLRIFMVLQQGPATGALKHQHTSTPARQHTRPCSPTPKDLVLPSFKAAAAFKSSPYLGSRQRERDILAFFRGDMGQRRWAQPAALPGRGPGQAAAGALR